jgi:hypothetical protein
MPVTSEETVGTPRINHCACRELITMHVAGHAPDLDLVLGFPIIHAEIYVSFDTSDSLSGFTIESNSL